MHEPDETLLISTLPGSDPTALNNIVWALHTNVQILCRCWSHLKFEKLCQVLAHAIACVHSLEADRFEKAKKISPVGMEASAESFLGWGINKPLDGPLGQSFTSTTTHDRRELHDDGL